MIIISRPADFLHWRLKQKAHHSIGFVPTMGALHEGHLSLVRRSKKENDLTVVSIFVNPTQFGPKEDFKKYPRPHQKDRRLLIGEKIQILFAPRPDSMYPSGYATRVLVDGLSATLCGSPKSRGPKHFEGVATVVAKLFNLIRPNRAYFGLKDFQQIRIIEQMNQDLNIGIQIVRCPTVREKDGLALSSRNAYLSASQRAVAPTIYAALLKGKNLLKKSSASMSTVKKAVQEDLKKIPQARLDYLDIVDPDTLQPQTNRRKPALIATALWLGKTRLIDNILVN